MRKLVLLVFILTEFLLFSQSSDKYIAVKNTNNLKKKFALQSSKIKTIYTDFVQEKHLEYLSDDAIISKGKLWYKKENKLRWEYITPYKYIIVINNGKFTIKDGSKVKEYDKANKTFKEVNNLIVSSLKGELLKDNKFTVKAYKNSKSYLIKMVPKDKKMQKFFSEIKLYFTIADLDIYKIKLIENKEDYTIISLKNKKINEAISSSIFTLN